jgi:hypothetical protein
MWKITLAYDENAPHWQHEYENEFEAWNEYFKFVDWGFADEYATLNMYTPSLKCFTKVFYRQDRKVVIK